MQPCMTEKEERDKGTQIQISSTQPSCAACQEEKNRKKNVKLQTEPRAYIRSNKQTNTEPPL